MSFTVADRGTPLFARQQRQQPKAAPLAHAWRDWTSPGVLEVVKAVTDDGWMFERSPDGTWMTGWRPTKTVVKDRLRSLYACRVYVGSGEAEADLKRISEESKEKAET